MNEHFIDDYDEKHIVKSKLRAGGQGAVYRTENNSVLIKIATPKESDVGQTEDYEKLNSKYAKLRALPLLPKTNITLPGATLTNANGYVMRLLNDMDSFDDLFSPLRGSEYKEPNEWLGKIKESCTGDDAWIANFFAAYLATGGLRNRLTAFLYAACALAKIHAAGLVYCDVSAFNMFASKTERVNTAWLIDCDNLKFVGDGAGKGLYTPGYVAPEVYKGAPNDFYSDAFSFAISLFWSLTGEHPLVGKAVKAALAELDDPREVEDATFACAKDFAYIGDESGGNESLYGDNFESFLSAELKTLFKRTFGKRARLDKPLSRVTVAEWACALARSLDATTRCPNCGMDDYGEGSACSFCGARRGFISVKSFRQSEKPYWVFRREDWNGPIIVPMRVLRGFRSDDSASDTAFKLERKGDDLQISEISKPKNCGYKFTIRSGNEEKPLDFAGVEKAPFEIIAKGSGKRETKLEIDIICP